MRTYIMGIWPIGQVLLAHVITGVIGLLPTESGLLTELTTSRSEPNIFVPNLPVCIDKLGTLPLELVVHDPPVTRQI